jgi:hypothetical protein
MGLIACLGVVVAVDSNVQDVTHEFRRDFMGDGGCLIGTPYEIDATAKLIPWTKEDNGQVIHEIIDLPFNPNEQSPPTLTFVVQDNGFMHQPTLQPGDYATEAYLQDSLCPGHFEIPGA